MSLAEELLADLEEGGEEALEETEGQELDEIADVTDVVTETTADSESVHSIAKLRDSEEVREI